MDSEQIVDAVRDWLDANDWHYEYDVEKHLIDMGVALESKIKTARIFIDIRDTYYLVYLYSPINGDKEDLSELNKYLTMANYGLPNGNFELDVETGEIRYKSFVDCDGLESLSDKVIQGSIYVPCVTMERYGDGIAALALGFSDAETELRKVENRDEEDPEN